MDHPYKSRTDPDARMLAVEGTLDEVSTPRFRDELFAFVDAAAGRPAGAGSADGAPVTVTVELSRVEYLLSVAIAALAAGQRHGDDIGTQVRFVAAAGSIAARVLEICGLPYESRTEPAGAGAPIPEQGSPT